MITVHAALVAFVVLVLGLVCSAAPVEQLSDLQDRFTDIQQEWGVLGINVCAHAPGQQPVPLQIGEKKYTSGLGNHANGAIEIALNGEYDHFDSDVGVQNLPQGQGVVDFQIFVDGKKQFDSGAMRGGDPAKTVSLAITGSQVLRLVANAAGDGINCDCADWADARLTRTPGSVAKPPERFDIAPFGKLMTSDPNRKDGARAARTEEYHADDMYLEWPLKPLDGDVRCIGLNWITPRPIREIGIVFKSDAPPTTGATAEIWVGQTAYQGQWKPLTGAIQITGKEWRLPIDPQTSFEKMRWILPKSAADLGIDHLTAITLTRTASADFNIETEPGHPAPKSITIYNGMILSSSPSKLSVKYTQSRSAKSERTLLRFTMPDDSGFSVAIDDILRRGPVYMRDDGLFIADASKNISLAQYKNQIAGKQTILEQVRQLPDQTRQQAMAKVHNPVQDQLPVMLSLASDNFKIIVERNGTIDIPLHPLKADEVSFNPIHGATAIAIDFSGSADKTFSRHLEGGWLPAPVIQVQQNGNTCQQRTMVIPTASGPLGIADFEFDSSSEAAAILPSFSGGTVNAVPQGMAMESDSKLLALVTSDDATLKNIDGKLLVEGTKGHVRLFIPSWNAKPEELAGKYPDPVSDLRKYWEDILSHATQIEVPDELVNNVIRASQTNCLMAARNDDNGKLIEPWISSINYGPLESESNSVIRGMDLLGHDEFARRSFDYFLSKYSASGMLTTGYTLMGTGWHLQTLGQHYALWHDDAWLKSVAPKVSSACEWINRQRQKSMHGPDGVDVTRMPQYGLAPPGVMADWGNYAYYFCLNGYFCDGLREAAAALNSIGFSGAKDLLADSDEYSKSILRAYHETQSLTPVYPLRDGTWVPGYPSQIDAPGPTNDFFPGQDGNRAWCYDIELGAHQLVQQGILDPRGRDVDWMMNHMEDVQFLASGWFDYPAAQNEADPFDFGGFAKVQPYYCRNAEIDAMRDDVKPFVRSYFNTMAAMLNAEVLSFQEHFHGVGAWNKTHETGYFLQQTRYMLVMEHGDELWLAPMVTNNWLKNGMTISVKNAPTKFGPVSYTIVSSADKGFIEATIDPPTRNAPKKIIIRLRDPNGRKIKSVKVNGHAHNDFNPATDTVTIAQPTGALEIHAEY